MTIDKGARNSTFVKVSAGSLSISISGFVIKGRVKINLISVRSARKGGWMLNHAAEHLVESHLIRCSRSPWCVFSTQKNTKRQEPKSVEFVSAMDVRLCGRGENISLSRNY